LAAPAAPASAPPAGAKPAASAPDQLPPLPGEIVVSGSIKAPPEDPLARANEKSYEVLQTVDDKFVGPVAAGYEKDVPRPLRMALRNFIRNVREPVVAIAYLLEIKPGKAFETVGRFGINSTIGLGGTIDVARSKPFNLPYRQNGLANGLGYYGVGPGPYLFLPLVGPTTVRDLVGLIADRLVVPLGVGTPFNKPYYAIPINVIDALDYRNEADEDFKRLRDAADPYSTYRRVYLQSRIDQIEALHGRGPLVKGQVRYGPFARPVGAAAGSVSAAEKKVMEQDEEPVATPAPVQAPVPHPAPEVTAPSAPPAPAPSPVFISEPVVQPIP
jgi:phospholipid-binding lipoprotein MlaA